MIRPSIKIVHTSDVHLDGRDRAPESDGFRNVAERAFSAVVDLVVSQSADLFLIAGDLFDSNRMCEADFEFVYSQLMRADCPIVLIPGNHDVNNEASVWTRLRLEKAGNDIHPITNATGELIDLPQIRTTIWGRSMAEHAPDNIPMDGVSTGPDDYWHIGMAHGDVLRDRTSGCSSPITHDEIESSELDYLALGHVHVWRQHDHGRTRACYPGSPVAEYATIAGGHAAVITLTDGEPAQIDKQKVSERKDTHHFMM